MPKENIWGPLYKKEYVFGDLMCKNTLKYRHLMGKKRVETNGVNVIRVYGIKCLNF